MKSLLIGALTIPDLAALDLQQTYEPIGGESTLRTIAGTGIKQMTWQKLRTTIQGGGWLPPGLGSLDYSQQLAVACIVPRAIACDGSRQATLPAARRADVGYTPWGLAIMPDGSSQVSPASLAGNVATVTAVTNAIAYQALYHPLLTCWVNRPSETGTRGDATYAWQLTAEEV